jgi:hypothetical protein
LGNRIGQWRDSTRHGVATGVAVDTFGNILVSGTVRSGFAHPVDVHGLRLKFNPRASGFGDGI